MTNNPEILCMQLFSTPILTSMLPNSGILNVQLQALIYAQKGQSPGMQKSNIGGWHSQDDMMGWEKGDSNNTHCHPGCLWSGVYYVDDGIETNSDAAGGHLIFEDPRFPMNSMYQPDLVMRDPEGVPQRNQHSVTPKSGMLIMFPSWLRHSVRPYKGDKDRISVAFNLMVKEG